MSNITKPNKRLILWTNDDAMAMALTACGHGVFYMYKNVDTEHNDWWFTYTKKLMNDIKKYENRKLEVNAQHHHEILRGVSDDLRFYQENAGVVRET